MENFKDLNERGSQSSPSDNGYENFSVQDDIKPFGQHLEINDNGQVSKKLDHKNKKVTNLVVNRSKNVDTSNE